MPDKTKVVVFSSKKPLLSKLDNLKKIRLFSYSAEDPENLKSRLAAETDAILVYLDATQFAEAEIKKLLVSQKNLVRFAIIDSTGVISDPAKHFHLGAVDYIGKGLFQKGVTGKRIKDVVDFCDFPQDHTQDAPAAPSPDRWRLSGKSWKNIKSGQEYTFCFMFVEIDLIDEWKQKSGQAHLDEVKAIFEKHMQDFAEQLSGKIWMWTDLGGLILFPFDGERCDAILPAIRLVLNRTIISAERYKYNTLISYRIALHIGNTTYKSRGNTATIVEDSVNFLFHLGHQFAQPGNFYLTEPVVPFIPEGLEDCFVPTGEFEDIEIRRMRLPTQ